MTDHLSESAIQQYALDGENCPAWMTEHVGTCERCRVQVDNYRLIFKEVGQMAAPVVEGADISKLVMMKLGPKRKDRSLSYWLVGAVLLLLAAGWIFRSSLVSITGDVPELILYILAGASVGIAIVRALGMVANYRHTLKNLDLS